MYQLMTQFPCSPIAFMDSVWRHRDLINQLTRREILGRYNGSFLGIIWSFLTPVLMLGIYTFVFSVVFKARWFGGTGSKSEFAILLFVGMIVFNVFSECISRAPGLVVGNPNYVKKVIFPLEIYPLAILGSALFHASVNLTVLLTFFIIFDQPIPATGLLFPVLLLPLVLLTIGISWFLSALGVYLRDISQSVGLAVTVLLFLSPVFYPLESLPLEMRSVASINPLAFIIESVRDALVWGRLPSAPAYFLNLALGFVIAFLGFVWFQKTRRGFSDVL